VNWPSPFSVPDQPDVLFPPKGKSPPPAPLLSDTVPAFAASPAVLYRPAVSSPTRKGPSPGRAVLIKHRGLNERRPSTNQPTRPRSFQPALTTVRRIPGWLLVSETPGLWTRWRRWGPNTPDSTDAWEALGLCTRRPRIRPSRPSTRMPATTSVYYRVLDSLRKNSWRGTQLVLWSDEPNRGFRSVAATAGQPKRTKLSPRARRPRSPNGD